MRARAAAILKTTFPGDKGKPKPGTTGESFANWLTGDSEWKQLPEVRLANPD